MSESSGENPLDEFASELSSALSSRKIDMSDVSANRIEGGQIHIDRSVARAVHGQAVHMEGSAAGYLRAEAVDIDDSVVGVLNAREVSVEEVTSGSIIAQEVQANRISAVVLLSGRVEGNVRTVFTPAAALAAGAGFGLSLFIVRRLFSRLWPFRGRKTN